MQNVANLMQVLYAWMRRLGPYVLLEMLLPGGTLFALLLFLYRRSHVARSAANATGLLP
jgi:hypothetical protein